MRPLCPVLTVLLVACGHAATPRPSTPPAPAETPAQLLARGEASLCQGDGMAVRFTSEASGGIPATMEGRLKLGPGKDGAIIAAGTFAGQDAKVVYETQGGIAIVAVNETKDSHETSEGACQSLAIGLARMGVLHNVAHMLMGGGTLDAEVPRTISIINARWTEGDTMTYDLADAGKVVAHGTMLLDRAAGLPLTRDLDVDTGGMKFHVHETYSWQPDSASDDEQPAP